MFTAGVEDKTGACTKCDIATYKITGQVENPCENDIAFTTKSTCLISSWEWSQPSGTAPITDAPLCGTAITTWKIKGGDTLTESQLPGAKIKADSYALDVTFGTSPSTTVTVGKIALK